MKKDRTYHSPLRDEQAQQTRTRILEGLLRALAHEGIADLSIPAVAREAGVSVPTIYRHFRTKRDLILALSSHALQRAGAAFVPITDAATMLHNIRAVILAYAADPALLRAVAVSEQSADLREAVVPVRMELIDAGLAAVAGNIAEPARQQLRHAIFALTTSATVITCIDLLGMTGAETADTIIWAIRALIERAHAPTTNIQEP